jgi:hypothetical protein
MCYTKWSSVINLDLFRKQVFSYIQFYFSWQKEEAGHLFKLHLHQRSNERPICVDADVKRLYDAFRDVRRDDGRRFEPRREDRPGVNVIKLFCP